MLDWNKKIEYLPDNPGVYIFKGKRNEPIYVGKALSLKSRVRSYFQDKANLPPKTALMLESVTDLEYILVQNELESLVLEQNLIKQFRPKFNVRIKDDKRYPWLRFTYSEYFPRLYVVRLPKRDKDKYFGPFPYASSMRQTMKLLRTIFPIRNCKLNIVEGKKAINRPCLEEHLNRCGAPCVGYISKSAYRSLCDQVCLFLEGRHQEVVNQLDRKMEQLAESLKFEEAAKIRDQIDAIKSVQTKQLIYTPDAAERDFIAAASQDDIAAVAVFVIRGGKLIGKEKYILDGVQGLSNAELLATFMKQHYQTSYQIPREFFLPEHPEDEPELIEWLSQIKEKGKFELDKKSSSKISLVIPERGEKRKLLATVADNAKLFLLEEVSRRYPELAKIPQDVVALKSALDLPQLPRYIEAFDISNIGGTDAVGSMVVFRNGKPAKSEYRKFRIKLVHGIDDYAMMQEVVSRRYTRLLMQQSEVRSPKSEVQRLKTKDLGLRTALLPDLILIDGGLGHLHSASDAIKEVFQEHKTKFKIPIIGLAKRFEEIYIPTKNAPILLFKDNKALQLLQRIRDEAHRFALTYHRQLRGR
ncbi:MAG: excinuclease ABC subunit UvrC, partial [bacterium]|nr:excinuclease ABC subunit UvrC [bacterium]